MANFGKYLNEGSLSRLWEHNELHDCGVITAFRGYVNCGYMDNDEPCFADKLPIKISRAENNKRNKALKSDLIKHGFKGSTKLVGVYPEGGKPTKEISYFVVDLNDSGDLRKVLLRLGAKYDQDSILFIPKGSIVGENKAYLMGTNNCPNNDIQTGQKMMFNRGRLGYDSPIYTSYIHGRPMIFEVVAYKEGLGYHSGTDAMISGMYGTELQDK